MNEHELRIRTLGLALGSKPGAPAEEVVEYASTLYGWLISPVGRLIPPPSDEDIERMRKRSVEFGLGKSRAEPNG